MTAAVDEVTRLRTAGTEERLLRTDDELQATLVAAVNTLIADTTATCTGCLKTWARCSAS